MTAPEKIWLGRDERYEGRPWRRLASQFDDEDGNETAEYTRSDLIAALEAAAEERGRIAGMREAAEIAGTQASLSKTNDYDRGWCASAWLINVNILARILTPQIQ